MAGVTVLVAIENRYRRGPDGRVCSTTGIDGYRIWKRYLETFDRVVVLARTAESEVPERGEPVEGPGVEVAPLPDYHGPWGLARVAVRLRAAARAAVAGADVLCLRVPGPIASVAWRCRGDRPFGVEVIGDPLDALSRGAVRSVVRPLARSVLARELRAMCRAAVAVSYVTGEALQRRYPAAGWVTACSDVGLDDHAFADATRVRQRAAARATAGRRIVFVGTLAQLYKGQETLLEAVARCRARGLDLTLTIVGDGRYRGRLEARARSLGDVVRFTGQLAAGAGVREELDRADLFVLPSQAEGMPRAMLEAMAWGVPAVGSRVGGMTELLPPERLVPPGDAAALADVLAALCAPGADLVDPALRDLEVARRYHERELRPRCRAFHARLAAAVRESTRARPIRILHVFGAMNRGGAETRTLEILRRLDRTRHAFDFCVLSGDPGAYAPEIRARGAAVVPCALRPGAATFPLRFLRLVRTGRFDALHSHVHHFSGAVLGLGRLAGVRTRIAHIRVTDDGRASTLARRAYRGCMRWLIDRHATTVIGVSRSAMDAFWGRGWEADRRKIVIYNGVEESRFAGVDAAGVRREFAVPDGARLVVHVARFDPEKNHHALVQIAKALIGGRPDVVFLLVGDGPLRDRVRHEVEAAGLGSWFRFAGARDDVPRLLAAGDAFVFPSLWEGLPGAVLEALAIGLPVVASPLPGVCEIASRVRGVVTADPADPTGFADRISQVLETRAKGERPQLPAVFSTAVSMERLLACYR